MSELSSDDSIRRDLLRYEESLRSFITIFKFPEELLEEPDSVTIKVSGPEDFNARYQGLKQWVAEKPYFVDIPDGRFYVAGRLLTSLSFRRHGRIDWVSLMESETDEGRPTEYIGAEYVGFFTGDINNAKRQLKRRKIAYIPEEGDDFEELIVQISADGQELRLSNKLLAETISEEIQGETARQLR